MTAGEEAPLVINGWSVFAHAAFLEQLAVLSAEVERLRKKDASTFKNKSASKRLAAITKLALNTIPADPASPAFRQGSTLGEEYKHWFRAKFFQQYRLFFRYHAEQKIIVLAWVNDDDSLRAYGSSDDAYKTFSRMLDSGHPPDDWNALLKESKSGDGLIPTE